jgi:hypothetical protein
MVEMVLAGGKARTVEQFRALGRQAGMELVGAGHPSGYGVTEFRPA